MIFWGMLYATLTDAKIMNMKMSKNNYIHKTYNVTELFYYFVCFMKGSLNTIDVSNFNIHKMKCLL